MCWRNLARYLRLSLAHNPFFMFNLPAFAYACPLMASNMENIGMYNATTMKPTTLPSTRIINGYSSEVSCLAMDCASSSYALPALASIWSMAPESSPIATICTIMFGNTFSVPILSASL